MKSILLAATLIASALMTPLAAHAARVDKTAVTVPQAGETITVGVDGMVCDFCAQSLKKTFAKEAGIDDVAISLERKQVTLRPKPGQTIDDAAIKKWISYAGYKVTRIARQP